MSGILLSLHGWISQNWMLSPASTSGYTFDFARCWKLAVLMLWLWNSIPGHYSRKTIFGRTLEIFLPRIPAIRPYRSRVAFRVMLRRDIEFRLFSSCAYNGFWSKMHSCRWCAIDVSLSFPSLAWMWDQPEDGFTDFCRLSLDSERFDSNRNTNLRQRFLPIQAFSFWSSPVWASRVWSATSSTFWQGYIHGRWCFTEVGRIQMVPSTC